jgi:excisionase family DNA binding protein
MLQTQSPMSDDQRLLTTHELARRLVLKPRGVEGLVEQGKIPAYKVSQRIVRFHWPEVKRALQKFRTKTK